MNILTLLVWLTSIYNYSFQRWDGETISMSSYAGKKILVVNVALTGPMQQQLMELKQLATQFEDSLVIVAFPTNDFGNTDLTDAEIAGAFQSFLRSNFVLASKCHVKAGSPHPIYGWLTRKVENEVANSEVKSDFQKYLIDEQGGLVGGFSGRISPLDSIVVEAIHRNYDF